MSSDTSVGGLERMVFFSDAVFAIVITLLVLPLAADVHPPTEPSRLADDVFDLWPKAMTFAISFLVIGQFWIAHHRLFLLVRRLDMGLLWSNLLFLLLVTFMPFPSAVLGASATDQGTFAVTFYATSMTAASAALTATWLYVVVRRLHDPGMSAAEVVSVTRRAVATSLVFAASIPVSLLGLAPAVALWLVVLPLTRLLVASRQDGGDRTIRRADAVGRTRRGARSRSQLSD